MTKNKELSKFLEAQNQLYLKALAEIKDGQKVSHWMWFIFPQIKGLGRSEMAQRFAINDLEEATAYLEHPVLGKHLVEISKELLNLQGKTAIQIFGTPDNMKLRSSMTLFSQVENTDSVFQEVINLYYDGIRDEQTIRFINNKEGWH
ncbi:DUF1810 domain-containing protein [Flavobacterium sp.]|uniref:DUF1810 domain-containing protein n=1 Tax=Flavobacterium sp. TaxID=239 RepID=UPI002619A684|nr:DUF1810 domain-containing protein [Flavobacterium sp.]